MGLYDFFWNLGDNVATLLGYFYDEDLGITFVVNTLVVLMGFFALFYWLRYQLKFNREARENSKQIK